MKISLVRGAFMTPYDLQLYAPLARRHALTLIGGNYSAFYPHRVDVPHARILNAPVWFAGCRSLGHRMPIGCNRLISWTLGRSFGLRNLAALVGSPDVLESAELFFTMTYQCLQIKRRLGCALIVTVRENLPHLGETHPLRRLRKRAVMAEADLIIAITPTTRSMLLIEGVREEKIRTVPLSIDMNRFQPSAKDPALMARLGLRPDECVVLFIGRLAPEKGIEEIILAMNDIAVNAPEVPLRFCFVGSGPLEGRLKQAQRRLGSRVILHRPVVYDAIPALHNLADIFILPSKPAPKVAEQFGFVLAESMACKNPVITTTVGSIPDVVGDAALLVQPGDWQALASHLLRLARSPEERAHWGQRGYARATALYDAEQNARALERIYEEGIRLRRGPGRLEAVPA